MSVRAWLVFLVCTMGSCFADDTDLPDTSGARMMFTYYCNFCGSDGADCCRLVNCFNREGWDNGCRPNTKPPLYCNRKAPSNNGQGRCERRP
jgi:hypothetical protein